MDPSLLDAECPVICLLASQEPELVLVQVPAQEPELVREPELVPQLALGPPVASAGIQLSMPVKGPLLR